jgi:hypothetical protein
MLQAPSNIIRKYLSFLLSYILHGTVSVLCTLQTVWYMYGYLLPIDFRIFFCITFMSQKIKKGAGACTFSFYQCFVSGMFIPDPGSEFFHPGSRIQGRKDPGSWIRIRNTAFNSVVETFFNAPFLSNHISVGLIASTCLLLKNNKDYRSLALFLLRRFRFFLWWYPYGMGIVPISTGKISNAAKDAAHPPHPWFI